MKIYPFYRHRLGQWTIAPMEVGGKWYCCCEQYMMAQKAILFKDVDSHTAIMNTNLPREHQILGRKVKNFNEEIWLANAQEIVYQGNLAKFRQHDNLRELLLSTGDDILAEASPTDLQWGIGWGVHDLQALIREQWRGKNWLGEVLMRVRRELKNDPHNNFGNSGRH